MLMKKLEESPFVPNFARLRGCRPAAFYLLLLAVVSVAAAQWSVDPTTSGLAGFVGSALRLPPSETWAILGEPSPQRAENRPRRFAGDLRRLVQPEGRRHRLVAPGRRSL